MGAKIKVRLKVEADQNGVDRNAVHYVHVPKKADAGKPAAAVQQKFSQSEFEKARAKQTEASGVGNLSQIRYHMPATEAKRCFKCGEKGQAHHDDYSKPFEIKWLCFKHHRELAHGQIVGAL